MNTPQDNAAAPLDSSKAMEALPEDPFIGVVGLGVMGSPMAEHLARSFPGRVGVTARRRPSAEAAVAAGARWFGTPRELGAACDVLVSVLPDLPQLREVLEGPEGVLAGRREGRRLLIIVSSTSSPVAVRELDEELAAATDARVRVVDAPVSGGEDGATAGTLSIMVGGDADLAETALTVLSPCGTPVHLGPLGSGEVAKACNQLVVSSTVLALGEAAALAERSGLDVAQLFDLLAGGYAGSRILQTRGPRIAARDYAPSGVARYMVKDLDFAEDVARSTGTRAVILPAVKGAFEELTAAGYGDEDIAVTRKFIETRGQEPGQD